MSEEHHESTGAGMYWFQVSAAIFCSAVLIMSVSWAGDILIPAPPNQDNAYEIDYPDRERDTQRARNVNLASVQVTWPFGMDSAREKELLEHNRSLLKSNPKSLTHVSYVDSVASVRAAPAAPKVVVPFPNLLASADLARGEVVAKKCLSCHTFGNGGKNRTGPNLWDVVGADRARDAGFKYSKAMEAFGGSWTLESLNDYLLKPGKYIKGTRMAFAGIRKDEDRASLIAYMRAQSESPVPLPDVVKIVPVEETPAEEVLENATEAALESAAAADAEVDG